MFLNKQGNWGAWLSALGAAAGWGLMPALTRTVWISGSVSSASVFLLIRFLISFAVFSLWLRLRSGRLPFRSVLGAIRRKELGRGLCAAWCIVTAANFWIQTLALSEIPAGLYALIFALHPILGLLLVRTRGTPHRSILGARELVGLSLVLAGTLIFSRGCDFSGHAPSLWGWLALFGGIATWLIYSALSRSLHDSGIEPAAVTWMTLAIGLIASLPALAHPHAMLLLLIQAPVITSSAVGAGVVGMFAFALYQYALSKEPRAAFLAQYAEPVAALAAAALLLGESVSTPQAGAALLSLVGLGYLMKGGDCRPAPTTVE